jgi:hypothetical protein
LVNPVYNYYMEILIKTAAFFSVAILHLSQDVYGNISIAGLNPDSEIAALTDTTLKQRINVDSYYLEIVPPSSGVQFYKDGIVFLSSSKSQGKMLPGHLSFGTVQASYAVLEDSVLGQPRSFSTTSSFLYPCDGITFGNDFNTMYFTKYSEKASKEKIFRAVSSSDGNWSEDAEPLDFCKDDFIYSHPALSADGKLMIFASNRTGSIGGIDLFVSQEKGGKWSDPVNLGDAVNSTYNESYPYLDQENNLFFSSDNIQGYGGYDIYACKFNKNTWEKPINLSAPLNTRFDDIAFTVNRKDSKSAFYTVKENSGKKSVQLYRVTMNNAISDKWLTLSQFFTRPDVSNMVILVLEPAVQATDLISETAETKISGSTGEKDNVIYRVQFLTSFNPRTRTQITVNGKDYSVIDYLYSGAYRLCVGEFSTITPALELQNQLRKNDYPQASVVVFKNNVISFDPELLKVPVSTQPAAIVEKTLITKTETQVKQDVAVATVAAAATTEGKKQVVIYRVQFATNATSKGSYKITINNKSYNTFEYLYSGAYRSTVGEFKTMAEATAFQKTVRESGYPGAFVVAFKDNVRSLDKELFK